MRRSDKQNWMEFHERFFGNFSKKNTFWAPNWNTLSSRSLCGVFSPDVDLLSGKETPCKDGSDRKVGTGLFYQLFCSLSNFLLGSYALWKNLREQKNEEACESLWTFEHLVVYQYSAPAVRSIFPVPFVRNEFIWAMLFYVHNFYMFSSFLFSSAT